MSLIGEQVLLRIYVSSADRMPFSPTSGRIVQRVRHEGMAGCTVFAGIAGFSALESPSSGWGLIERVPQIVEIVDLPRRIGDFVDGPLAELMTRGLATLERAAVLMYRHREARHQEPISIAPPVRPLAGLPSIAARPNMKISDHGVLLRVFVGESDLHNEQRLYEAIVSEARRVGLAGATVLRGIEGFGANSVIHKSGLLALSADLPLVIEMVDLADKIERFLPTLQQMVGEGMITMEQVRMLSFGAETQE